MPKVQKALAAALAMGLVGVIAACGDTITATRSWNADAVASQYMEKVVEGQGAYFLQHVVLDGPLVDAAEQPYAGGSHFREDCAFPVTSGGGAIAPGQKPPPGPPGTCTLTVSTGGKLYVATGKAPSQFASFPSAAGHGSLTTKLIKDTPANDGAVQTAEIVLLTVTARP